MSETEMGFGSGCLTVIVPAHSAVPLRGATQSERGRVDTPDQTPSSIKADAREMFFTMLVVGQLEESSMLIDPLRQVICAVCRGSGMKGTFPHFTLTFIINLSTLPSLAIHSNLPPLFRFFH